MCDHIFKFGMKIVYDEDKNESNYRKHNYELACAQDVIDSLMLFGGEKIIFSDGYEEGGEARYMIIAEYNSDVVLLAYTWRDDDLRAISLRSASDKERKLLYEKP